MIYKTRHCVWRTEFRFSDKAVETFENYFPDCYAIDAYQKPMKDRRTFTDGTAYCHTMLNSPFLVPKLSNIVTHSANSTWMDDLKSGNGSSWTFDHRKGLFHRVIIFSIGLDFSNNIFIAKLFEIIMLVLAIKKFYFLSISIIYNNEY